MRIPCVSQEHGDQATLAKSFYLLAVLASHEQQHGQALALLEQAHEIGGDEDFWYNLFQSILNTTAQLNGDDIYTQVFLFFFFFNKCTTVIYNLILNLDSILCSFQKELKCFL